MSRAADNGHTQRGGHQDNDHLIHGGEEKTGMRMIITVAGHRHVRRTMMQRGLLLLHSHGLLLGLYQTRLCKRHHLLHWRGIGGVGEGGLLGGQGGGGVKIVPMHRRCIASGRAWQQWSQWQWHLRSRSRDLEKLRIYVIVARW